MCTSAAVCEVGLASSYLIYGIAAKRTAAAPFSSAALAIVDLINFWMDHEPIVPASWKTSVLFENGWHNQEIIS